jgi:hypothetical protein
MFEVLATHLDALVSPEQKTLILEACEALLAVGITRHDLVIDNELSVMDSLDSDLALNVVDNILIPLYRQTLGEYGIVLEDDVQLKYLTDILTGLTRIENWSDLQTITDLCHADEEADAVLSDLLEMVGQYSSADYHSQMVSVNPALIDRIAETCEPKVYSELVIPEALVNIVRDRVRAFLISTEGDTVSKWLLDQITDQGLRLGTPMAYLIQAHPIEQDVWEKLKPDDQARSMMALVMASAAGLGQEVTVACMYAEPHLQAPADMIKFRAAALDIYNRYKQIAEDRRG